MSKETITPPQVDSLYINPQGGLVWIRAFVPNEKWMGVMCVTGLNEGIPYGKSHVTTKELFFNN